MAYPGCLDCRAGTVYTASVAMELYIVAAGQFAAVKSWDADGWTFTWTKDGAPAGIMSCYALLFR